eukprot:CAMPEP_0172175994 /NCGR_PEP_ID=MMETSP1050-20130122/14548_1 /TAXON_ID=233186 /ORGANISM="Cryptomonas curvata, Strain CCAP979/52" /LENGTH=246 /DNA_ID=CAMNT_0012848181 /DNA_START=60 /DNA_END=797 /DNA_ORIENTATION=+
MEHEFLKVGVSDYIDERTKEDSCTVKVPFLNEESAGFFGLFEGHRSGWAAADAVSTNLHEILQHHIRCTAPPQQMAYCFESAFAKMDGCLKSVAYDRGASASTCLVRKYDRKTLLHFANVGDTRVILCRGGKAVRLTLDHTISDEKERARVQACPAYKNSNDKIRGLSRHTRALGNHVVKQWVISTPHYIEMELSPEDSFLLLVSRRLCDAIKDQEAVEIARGAASWATVRPGPAQAASDALLRTA